MSFTLTKQYQDDFQSVASAPPPLPPLPPIPAIIAPIPTRPNRTRSVDVMSARHGANISPSEGNVNTSFPARKSSLRADPTKISKSSHTSPHLKSSNSSGSGSSSDKKTPSVRPRTSRASWNENEIPSPDVNTVQRMPRTSSINATRDILTRKDASHTGRRTVTRRTSAGSSGVLIAPLPTIASVYEMSLDEHDLPLRPSAPRNSWDDYVLPDLRGTMARSTSPGKDASPTKPRTSSRPSKEAGDAHHRFNSSDYDGWNAIIGKAVTAQKVRPVEIILQHGRKRGEEKKAVKSSKEKEAE